ncbi:MAG: Flp pilus assembly complex ATPase component TadA [Gammaproteobacteria bacterium]|nr:Flp pilus assembly complex ATPase component TadA [Gammaproteobacteria bacterium]
MDTQTQGRKSLGQLVLDEGLVSEIQLNLARREQKRQGLMLGEVLIELGFISADALTDTLAHQSKTEVVDLINISIDPDVLSLIPHKEAIKHKLIPLEFTDGVLTVAFADAFNVVAIDAIERITGFTVKVVSASQSTVLAAVEQHYSQDQSISKTIDILMAHGISANDEGAENESPMVRLANQVIAYGIKKGAADIHLEPGENVARIRFRIDGVLHTEFLVPATLIPALTSRIKLIANLNISEKRIPQDGRIHFKYGSKAIDLRVSTLPTSHGESIVMRILDAGNVKLSLDWLGFSDKDKTLFTHLMHQSYGMVLITGPTGSGKTSTLYTALSLIDTETRSVFTLEDPIEYSLPEIRQTQINSEMGMDFATGLKALLRQDPDVILIGEIRDLETAELAIRAALTGHLVLATLHTNTAAGVIPRLIDMGIERYLLPPALNAAIGQRLVRKLCIHCKKPSDNIANTIQDYNIAHLLPQSAILYQAVGCQHCGDSGYKGRLAIYEVMSINESMHNPIIENASVYEIEQIARENGMTSMLEDGLAKAAQGLTTVDEVIRLVSNG